MTTTRGARAIFVRHGLTARSRLELRRVKKGDDAIIDGKKSKCVFVLKSSLKSRFISPCTKNLGAVATVAS